MSALLFACLLAVSWLAAPAGASNADFDLERLSRIGRGTFTWPTTGRLTQKFGCTGFGMNTRRGRCAFFHNGLDIANRPGTRVRAAAPGIVRYIGWDPYDRGRDRAWVVIVAHGRGLRSWYAHLQPRKVIGLRVGDRVRRGELIGYMGKTGKVTGVHLHFMAEYRGRFVNPYKFLPAGSRKPPKRGRALLPTRRSSAVLAGGPPSLPV